MRTRKARRRNAPSARVVLNCCGYKRCPVAEALGDGTLVLVDQDDGKDERIVLAPAQVAKLRELLNRGSP